MLFLLWSVMSTLLSLDVAAVAAADVGLEVAGDAPDEQAAQLRAAVLGSNVGSMLFPFSNLTNLVLVSATGMAFGTYVLAAAGPQLVATIAGALILLLEGRDLRPRAAASAEPPTAPQPAGPAMIVAGVAALLTSLAAIAVGFAGGDVSIAFAVGAAVVCAAGVGSGATGPLPLARSLPPTGILLIVASGMLLGPIQQLAVGLPVPDASTSVLALVGVTLVGGLLAATINNLPAAAIGAVWLTGADPVTVVAYLVGTNIVCVLTPHGSIATMLSHAVARRRGLHHRHPAVSATRPGRMPRSSVPRHSSALAWAR